MWYFSEPFIEALPQVLLSFFVIGTLASSAPGSNLTSIINDYELLLWVTFGLSILTSTFGMAKLMKNGPIRILSQNGPLEGYLTVEFLALMIAMASFIISKASWIILNGYSGPGWSYGQLLGVQLSKDFGIYLIWVGFSILPQLIMVNFITLHYFCMCTVIPRFVRGPVCPNSIYPNNIL